jgi:hypothetical protein
MQVVIYHPTQVPPDAIMERLTSITSKQRWWTGVKAAAASLMLPIAFGVDIVVIPGPSVCGASLLILCVALACLPPPPPDHIVLTNVHILT